MSELGMLLKKDWRQAANLRHELAEQSRFKLAVILFFALGMLGGLYGLFWEGFTFLERLGGIGLMIIHRLLAFCFLALTFLLILSSSVSAYGTFFGDRDMGFLKLMPVRIGTLIRYKFLHAAFYASWAFFFIIVPFVMAFAMQQKLSGFALLASVVFSLPFVMICSSAGALLCLVFIRWMPPRRMVKYILMVVILAVGIAGWKTFVVNVRLGEDVNVILNRVIPGLKLASHPLLPGYWASEGILSISRGQWARGLMFGLLLFSSAGMGSVLLEAAGSRIYEEGYQKLMRGSRRHHRMHRARAVMERTLVFLPRDMRSILVKDICIFLRDPAQWVQALFFLGMLGLYFLNLRNLRYHTLPLAFRNLIAFLNVFSVSAVLTSLGARFVYPQLSFEGHAFWVLGLSPLSMKRILLSKFAGALFSMVFVSLLLMGICVRMLNIEAYAGMVSMAVAFAVSVALSGFSCGLGALFMDLKHSNPSAIVSSFGGTLNLVCSLVFIFMTMFPFAFVFQLYYRGYLSPEMFVHALMLGGAWLVGITLAAVLVPLWLGLRSLMKREY